MTGLVNDNVNNDSFKKRYLYKLFANTVILLISIITVGIIPRALGPVGYGNFSFISNSFLKIVKFLDAGTSTAFYVKLSQRPKEYGIIKFYWIFVIVLIFVSLTFILLTIWLDYSNFLWPGQSVKFILMAFFWALFTWLVEIFSRMIDAYALTAKGEIIRIFQKTFGASIIVVLFLLDWLSISVLFIYHYFILVVLLVFLGRLLIINRIPIFPKIHLSKNKLISYVKEFYIYSGPLVIYGIITLLVGLADIWLLQLFSGSAQQGFFSLSDNISRFCFIFTGAMTTLITREFTIAYKNKKIDRLGAMFNKNIPILYGLTAFFSFFVLFQAKKVALLFGGEMFANATIPITIMALYPIHQTYGQLNGATFLAMERTKTLRNIGIIVAVLGLPLLYFLIAPPLYYGLDLGATGLAIKMVIIQFIFVNIQLWYNCKSLNLSYKKFLVNQFIIIFFFGSIAFISVSTGDTLIENTIASILFSGCIYTLLVGSFIYIYPSIISLNKQELHEYLKKFYHTSSQLFKKFTK